MSDKMIALTKNAKWKRLITVTAILTLVYLAFSALRISVYAPRNNQSVEPVDVALMIASAAITIVAIGYIYNYLRRQRLVRETTIATALVEASATTIAAVAAIPLTRIYLNEDTPLGLSLVLVVYTFIFSLIFSYLIARIFKWRYDRKYGFEVEK